MSVLPQEKSPIWQQDIPVATADLIAKLDAATPSMPFRDVRSLADSDGERERLNLAVMAGRRELVDQLKSWLNRK